MQITNPGPSDSRSSLIQVLKPLTKASPRRPQQADRKACKSAVVRDTPKKSHLEEKKKQEQEAKKKKKVSKHVFSENK